jgi:uncharacterized protein (DUF1778 family)
VTKPTRNDDAIRIRMSAETKAVLTRAAELRGLKLSEFILTSARRQAEGALLDQGAFFLEHKAHEKFLAMLDKPRKPKTGLKQRMRRKAAWESRANR